MRLSELIGLDVHTESGDHIGHVHDVRGELRPRTLKVTGLVVGRVGVLERLGLGAFRHHRAAADGRHDSVARCSPRRPARRRRARQTLGFERAPLSVRGRRDRPDHPRRGGSRPRAVLPAHGVGRGRQRAAEAPRARRRRLRSHVRGRPRARLRRGQGIHGRGREGGVRRLALRPSHRRARRRARGGHGRPAANRRGERCRSEAPRPQRREHPRRDRLRLAGGVAGRGDPGRRSHGRARLRLLPHARAAAVLLRDRRRRARRVARRSGRPGHRRHDHDLTRSGPPRRVAARGRARLRRRRE